MPLENEVTEILTLDSARILNLEENDWEKGWLRVYKRHKVKQFFDAESVSTTAKTSSSFNCAPYHEFEILIDLTASGGSDNILIEVQVSDDNAVWYKKMDGLFGDLRYSGTGGDKKESVRGFCLSPYIRLRTVASAGTYTLTLKMVLVS